MRPRTFGCIQRHFSVSIPSIRPSPVSVTRQMAAALPKLQAMAKEKGLKMHHLGAGYPHPEVSDPSEYIAHKMKFFEHLGPVVTQQMYNYTDTLGPLGPRKAFADVYGRDFGIEKMDPDFCVPTVGASGGISMMCNLFERTGDKIAYLTDAPTYAGFVARATLCSQAKLYSAGLDSEGVIISELAAEIKKAREDGRTIAFYYTVPDGHNPGGISFSAERRVQLMALLKAEGILAVEDAPYTYISFMEPDQRPKPLIALDPAQSVHLFTASKIGLPGPRVGFLYSLAKLRIAGGEEVSLRDLVLTESASDLLFQNPEALYGFQAYLSDENFNTRDSIWPLAAQKLAVYAENRNILLEVLEERLGDHQDLFSWTEPGAGFFSVFTFKSGNVITDQNFTNELVANHGVVVIPMFGFYPDDARERDPRAGLNQVRLSFCFNEQTGEGRRVALREAANAFADAVLQIEGRS